MNRKDMLKIGAFLAALTVSILLIMIPFYFLIGLNKLNGQNTTTTTTTIKTVTFKDAIFNKLIQKDNKNESNGPKIVNFKQLLSNNKETNKLSKKALINESELPNVEPKENVKDWELKISKILNEHKTKITGLLSLENSNFLSSANDNTIKLWSIETFDLLKTINFQESVTSMVLLNNNILAIAVKFEIILLDSETLNEIKRLKDHHKHFIYTLTKLENGNLASSSVDENINVFDLTTNELIFSLNQTNEAFTCLATLENNLLASGSTNSIRIWDLNTRELKKTIYSCASILAVSSNKYLISSCEDSQNDYSIKIWNPTFETPVKMLSEHKESVLSLVLLSNNYLISGSSDSTIKIWDLNTHCNSIKTINDMNKNVEALTVLNNFLVAGDSKGKIYIWKIFK